MEFNKPTQVVVMSGKLLTSNRLVKANFVQKYNIHVCMKYEYMYK